MADSITIKSGALGDRPAMPTLNEGEFGFRTDEKALYIGSGGNNWRLCGAGDIAELRQLIEQITARLDAISPSE